MSKLKNFFDATLVKRIAGDVRRVHKTFDVTKFEKGVMTELEDFELKGRTNLIAENLHENLPENFPSAIKILLASFSDDKFVGDMESMSSFYYSPHAMYVEKYGLEHFDESMDAILKITKVFTSEFCIRPFIQKYGDRTLELMAQWTQDDNEHVRRLVSEGSRPRLPWSSRLPEFIKDPSPVFELLEKLKQDPSIYVRKSVANNLNDIAKDHPDKVIEVLSKWKDIDNEGTQWIIKHASRTLVKEGHPEVLKLLGFSTDVDVSNFQFPKKVKIGEELTFDFDIKSNEEEELDVVIDYSVHYMKSNGKNAPKVFKLTKKTLKPGKIEKIKKKQSFKLITTRKYYPGTHHIEILVNGSEKGKFSFELKE
jgi:3-methyladenine DNA glycosylase AlkC